MSFYTNESNVLIRGPVLMDRLSCAGNEMHVNDCSYRIEDECSHRDDLFLACKGILMLKKVRDLLQVF